MYCSFLLGGKMLSIVQSMGLHGLEGYLINVEVDTSAGLPSFDIVGLPDVSVKEGDLIAPFDKSITVPDVTLSPEP